MKELSIIGASPSISHVTDPLTGQKREVKSSGYEKAKSRICERWCVSSVFKKLDFPVDRIFQLHKEEVWEPWIPEEGQKVVVGFPSLTASVLPVQKLLVKYGPVFGSSIAWMLAMAIEEGYQRINIFGVDMATQKEYIEQRDTFFYLCGRAEALGIDIRIPEDSRTFFKDRIYGVM